MGYSLKIAIDVFKDELTILYSKRGIGERNDGMRVGNFGLVREEMKREIIGIVIMRRK